jgi:hypothetical protein
MGLICTNRGSPAAGPAQNILTNLLAGGPGTYAVQAYVKLASGADAANVTVQLAYGGSNHYYNSLGAVNGTNWTKVTGTNSLNWNAPLTGATLFLQTTNVTGTPEDVYLDDVIMQLQSNNVPLAPAGLGATALPNANGVTLEWTNVSGADRFNVKRATNGVNYVTIATVTNTSYVDTNVFYGTDYFYAISAVNYVGESSNSSSAAVVTYPPPSLTWNATANINGPQDGGGAWDDTSSEWWNSFGGNNLVWSDTAPKCAIFGAGGTAGTVILATNHSVTWLVFNPVASGAYTLDCTGPSSPGSLSIGSGIAANASAALTTRVSLNLLGGQTWTIASNQTLTVSGNISGAGPLTINATNGSLVLAGSGTCNGGTVLNSGTLLLNGLTDTNAVVVQTAGVLAGSGFIGGTVTLNGAVSPGPINGVGTLTTGSETWSNGAAYIFALNNATNSAGQSQLNINGTLNDQVATGNPFNPGSFTVKLVSLTAGNVPGLVPGFDSESNYSWLLATASGGVANFKANLFTVSTGSFSNAFTGTFSVRTNLNSLLLNYVAVPLVVPRISALTFSGGKLGFDLSGTNSQSYRILASTNLQSPLTNWWVLTNGVFGTNAAHFTDPGTNSQRFYRVASP